MKVLLEAWQANDAYAIALALAVLTGALLFLIGLRFGILRALRGPPSAAGKDPDGGFASRIVASTSYWLLAPVALYAATSALELPQKLDQIVDVLAVVAMVMQIAIWTNRLIALSLARQLERYRGVDGDAVTVLSLLAFGGRVLVWTFTLLLVLNHLNFNITALVTGLGIGGVAIALAIQNILSDLFASLSIVLDKPFVVGDFIIVDDCMGTIEHIGLKTTRARSLGGELIVFSNADLLKSRIRNYKRMYERRVVFTIGVTYDTSYEGMQQIPAILRDAVEKRTPVRFDRAHFKEFGESALTFEVVYYVLVPDFNVYMDIQEGINLSVLEEFRRRRIRFAHPMRALIGDKSSLQEFAAPKPTDRHLGAVSLGLPTI